MNRDIAEKWIADLRANPPQAMGQLFDGNGHCCLGRLCVLHGLTPERRTDNGEYRFLGEAFKLPTKVMNWAGMKTHDGRYPKDGLLPEDNDSGKTFTEIADIIEAHVDEL
jgi:hypothetical protein